MRRTLSDAIRVRVGVGVRVMVRVRRTLSDAIRVRVGVGVRVMVRIRRTLSDATSHNLRFPSDPTESTYKTPPSVTTERARTLTS